MMEKPLTQTAGIGGCVLYEAVGDERKFTMPMLKILKDREHLRVVGLVRFSQDIKPLMDTGLFEAVYCTADMLDAESEKGSNLMDKARGIEQRFDTVFHYNLADRRLYFTGCTSFPYTRVETGQTYEEWVRQFVGMYDGIEEIFRRHGVTFALNGRRVVCDIARGLDVPTRCLGYSFLHDRMIWKDGIRVNEAWLRAAHEKARDTDDRISAEELSPPPFHMQIRRKFFAGIGRWQLLKTTLYILLRTTYWHMRKYDKVTKFGYSPWRHIRFHFQRRAAYKFLVRRSVRAEALIESEKPFVFLALQMEPEVLLSGQTPEFFDQIAMIHQVAKELPVGTYLAIKDHVPALGYRDLSFYRMLDTMPNVVLVDPSDFAIPLIQKSRAVISLLGRSAFEAAAFGVPVLAFSPNMFFGYLPHVKICTDLSETRATLKLLLSYDHNDRLAFAREGELLLAAMHNSTVDPADFPDREALGQALLSGLSDTFQDLTGAWGGAPLSAPAVIGDAGTA